LTIAANVLVDEEDNLFYRLDLETWAQEGKEIIHGSFIWVWSLGKLAQDTHLSCPPDV